MVALITALAAYVGIDVAKGKLDVVLRLNERTLYQVFANTKDGFAALDAWLRSFELTPCQVRVCLEATGSYSDAISQDLFTRGYLLCVLNPAVLVDYRRSQKTRSKTDKLDAHLLAHYAQGHEPRPYVPLPDAILTLRALLHRRDALQQMLRQERNRLHAGRMTQTIEQRMRTHIELLQDEFKTTEREIKAHLKAHPDLLTTWQRLQTIPGIGWLSAARLLAHLGDIARFPKVGSLVSLAGLSVKDHQSGTSVRGRSQIDRQGRKDLRQAMYMCALVAKRCSAEMRAWAQHLTDQHKARKVVIVAVIRKLLHIVYGVWKSGQEYQPAVAFPNAA